MTPDNLPDIKAIQTHMTESARVRGCFEESELDDLRCLVRVTLEIRKWLQTANLDSPTQYEPDLPIQCDLEYNLMTIISAIDSFVSVDHAYRVLHGAMVSNVEWGVITLPSLKEVFLSGVEEFIAERDFIKACRLLLDLFKMETIFIGLLFP
jgi:hypothetical protein